MAINRVNYPTDLSTQTDFSAHGDLIEGRYLDQANAPQWVVSGNIPQGVVFQIGGVVYRVDSDTAITGTASDYVKVVPDGATASAEYASSLSGVAWSKQYNGYYDTSSSLVLFDEGKALAAGQIAAVFGRYLMQQPNGDVAVGRNLDVDGALDVTGGATFDSATVSGTLNAPTVGGSMSVEEVMSADIFDGVRRPHDTLNGAGIEHGTIFSRLSPHVPNIGNELIVSGAFADDSTGSASIVVFSHVERKTSTSITMHGVYFLRSRTTSTVQVQMFAGTVNQGSTSVYDYLSLAW